MAKTHIITGAAAAVIVLIAGSAKAQGVSDSFDALQGRVNSGARVVVKDQTGRETEGVLTALTASGISLTVGNDQRQWRAAEVSELRRRGDSVKNGALIGIGIGLGAGVAGGMAMGAWMSNEGGNAGGAFIAMSALGAGIGAAAGAGFDGLRQGQTVLFRRASSGRGSVSLAPLVTPTVRALHVTMRF